MSILDHQNKQTCLITMKEINNESFIKPDHSTQCFKSDEKRDIDEIRVKIKTDKHSENNWLSFLKICAKKRFRDITHCNLLHIAVLSGCRKIVSLLIEEDCYEDARNAESRTALHVACQSGYVDIVKFLLEVGVNVHVRDQDQKTSLHLSAEGGFQKVLELLLEFGADANTVDRQGQSALHLAAKHGHAQMVKYLLGFGCSHNILCRQGLSPLQYAVKMGHTDVYNALVQHGALPKDEESRAKLCLLAVRNNHINLLKKLISSDLVEDIGKSYWSEVLSIAQVVNRNAAQILLERRCKESIKVKKNPQEKFQELTEGENQGEDDVAAFSQADFEGCMLMCFKCTATFASLENLQVHVPDCDGSTPISSASCRKTSTDEVVADVFETDMPIDIPENVLSLPLPTLNSLNNSQVTKPFQCSECGTGFTVFRCLKAHMKLHSDNNPFKCKECGKRCCTAYSLRAHYRSHSGEKPYECKDCGKRFSFSHSLKIHSRLHTGERPYGCKECGKSFPYASSYNAHLRTHNKEEKPFECDECGKRFPLASNLDKHRKSHSGEKLFQCEECGKTFAQAESLYMHRRLHRRDKPYECKECGKTFLYSSSYYYHRKTHTGKKPYECIVCGNGFFHKHKLEAHMKEHDDAL